MRTVRLDGVMTACPNLPLEIADRVFGRIKFLARLKTYHPLMEVYLQNLAPDETRGWVPTDDNYYLGQFFFDGFEFSFFFKR